MSGREVAGDVMTADGPAVVALRTAKLSLDLCPSLGGSIAALRWTSSAGTELDLLRPASDASLAARDVESMSCFPLTPFSNRLRDGRCTFRGTPIEMPRNTDGPHVEHGHGWQRPWQIVDSGSNHATLRLTHTGDAWPFPYQVEQRFWLRDDRLDIDLVARNAGSQAMPYGFGLHPYFPRTPECTLAASVDGFWETDDEVMPTRRLEVPALVDPSRGLRVDEHELDNVFTGWNGVAAIRWPERGLELTLTATAPLRFLVVYTPRREDYFCAEPVSHCTDAFNMSRAAGSEAGTLILEPGAALSTTISFRARELFAE